ncbi:hypothetical protein [Streptomyces sp. A0958]|uniref:hypothetical protein n=1 Tax=Streptomyces sp. A0958 TaxID=2563101 RepID=UPI00144521FF|nr:hypothetical protein [Streptomyces sp. A0958]
MSARDAPSCQARAALATCARSFVSPPTRGRDWKASVPLIRHFRSNRQALIPIGSRCDSVVPTAAWSSGSEP